MKSELQLSPHLPEALQGKRSNYFVIGVTARLDIAEPSDDDASTKQGVVARALLDLGRDALASFVTINCPAIPAERFEETVFGAGDDLIGRVAVGSFREGLLFRLNTLVITLPAQRDRGEDVLLLICHDCDLYSQHYSLSLPSHTPCDIATLLQISDRAIVPQSPQSPIPCTLCETVVASERKRISRAFQEEGRMDRSAAVLGIGRRTLNEKIVKPGLDKDALLNG